MSGESGEGNISGMLVQSHEEHFRRRLSPGQYEQYRALLSDADRRAIDDARPLGWTPIGVSDRMFDAASRVAGRAKWEFHDEILLAASGQNMKKLWRVVLNALSDEFLFARADLIVRKVYDRGHVRARVLSKGRAEVEISEWPGMPDRAIFGLRVSIVSALTAMGRHGATANVRRTPGGAVYDVHWAA